MPDKCLHSHTDSNIELVKKNADLGQNDRTIRTSGQNRQLTIIPSSRMYTKPAISQETGGCELINLQWVETRWQMRNTVTLFTWFHGEETLARL